jgi:hypothetical protein
MLGSSSWQLEGRAKTHGHPCHGWGFTTGVLRLCWKVPCVSGYDYTGQEVVLVMDLSYEL